ncbi:hypothetical protein, partial [Pseudomonas aeruginosa]|uniref:hypothetical protein n=1 Tax=Pseudomonas aeruginosa TaxID=287 RepID=UPI002E75E5DF
GLARAAAPGPVAGGAFEMPLGGVFEGCGDVSFLAVLEIYYVPWQFLFLSVLCFRGCLQWQVCMYM